MQPSAPSSRRTIFIAASIFIIGLLVFSSAIIKGGFISLPKPQTEIITPDVSQPLAPTLFPTQSPKSKTSLKVNILNGSGTPGLATTAKNYLESLGYTDISTGNADNYGYLKTEIRLNEKAKPHEQAIISDLSAKYSLSNRVLNLTNSGFDLEIVLGKE